MENYGPAATSLKSHTPHEKKRRPATFLSIKATLNDM